MVNIFDANSRIGRVLIKRAGYTVDIYRNTDTSENKYGKTSDTGKNLEYVATEIAARTYENGNNEPGYGEVTGGRVNTDSPRIAFRDNTEAVEGDYIEFRETSHTYQLDELIESHAYMLFRTTLVDDAGTSAGLDMMFNG